MSNNFPSVSLRLNMQVLSELFPEGSQARVDLTAAILNQAAKKYVKGTLTQDIREYLELITSNVSNSLSSDINRLIREHFEAKGGYWERLNYHVGPNGKVNEAISFAVKRAFDDIIATAVLEQVSDAITNYRDKVKERVDYEVRQRMDQITRAEVSKRVSEALTIAGLEK